MTNLGLKTLKVVPCYCQDTLPMMWEALNTISLSICRTMSESGHLLAHSISNVTSISHDTHQLTDFTALAALLAAITEPPVVLPTHYAYRTSTRHIYVCDPFTYLQEKK